MVGYHSDMLDSRRMLHLSRVYWTCWPAMLHYFLNERTKSHEMTVKCREKTNLWGWTFWSANCKSYQLTGSHVTHSKANVINWTTESILLLTRGARLIFCRPVKKLLMLEFIFHTGFRFLFLSREVFFLSSDVFFLSRDVFFFSRDIFSLTYLTGGALRLWN